MGVRGLTTYIAQNSDRFHQGYRLHDSYVVVDGSSLASQLYSYVSKCNSAFGGDYAKFSRTVTEFFILLKKCNVTPIVILDGGYELRKLKTVWSRLKNKFYSAKSCNPTTQSHICVFPIFIREVFKQVLIENNVRFAQADFEADQEIAAIARFLKCPVLSFDSDYYIYDVLYIPFTTFELDPVKVKTAEGSTVFAVKCKIYRVENFLKNFGGLDKSLLPLMAILLGNDYVPVSTFKKFYNHVKIEKKKKLSYQQVRISAIIKWLRSEDLNSAVKKILGHLRKKDRRKVFYEIQRSIESYGQCSSTLLPFVGLEGIPESSEECYHQRNLLIGNFSSILDTRCHQEDDVNILNTEVVVVSEDCEDENNGGSEENNNSDDDDDDDNASEMSSKGDSEVETEKLFLDCELKPKTNNNNNNRRFDFPVWFQNKFRKGDVMPCVSDMFYLKKFFCLPQVEDFSLNDSYEISLPIMAVVFALVLLIRNEAEKDVEVNFTTNKRELSCFLRNNRAKTAKVTLEAALDFIFPFLDESSLTTSNVSLVDLEMTSKVSILYNALGLTSKSDVNLINKFPDKWKLFAMTVVFWGRNSITPKISIFHIHALVLCMIDIGVVDCATNYLKQRKCPVIKSKRRLQLIRKGSELKESIPDNSNCPITFESVTSVNKSMNEVMTTISTDDCFKLVDSLFQFHKMDEDLRTNVKLFSPTVIHAFAQLQTCLYQTVLLNSILDFPVPQCNLGKIYCGTFIYTAFTEFKKCISVQHYVASILQNSPSILALYVNLFETFSALLPDMDTNVKVRQAKRRRKKKKRNISENTVSENDLEPVSENDYLDDEENKFSLLSRM